MYGIIEMDCFSYYLVNPTSVTQRIKKKIRALFSRSKTPEIAFTGGQFFTRLEVT